MFEEMQKELDEIKKENKLLLQVLEKQNEQIESLKATVNLLAEKLVLEG